MFIELQLAAVLPVLSFNFCFVIKILLKNTRSLNQPNTPLTDSQYSKRILFSICLKVKSILLFALSRLAGCQLYGKAVLLYLKS